MYENKSAFIERAGFIQPNPLAPPRNEKGKMEDSEAIQLILQDGYCLSRYGTSSAVK